MARLLALYKVPTDKKAFDAYYFGTHVPLAKTIPGLRKYEVNAGPVMGMQGLASTYLVATLSFDSMADIAKAMGTAEGQATAADIPNFASAGVDIIMFDDKAV